MTRVEEIKQQIEEARALEKAQEVECDKAMKQWKAAMDTQYATSVRLYKLMAELREECQKAFDEDGEIGTINPEA